MAGMTETTMKLFSIPGLGGIYKITKCGRIYNSKSKKWLVGSIKSNGYRRISIDSKEYLFHRLVALTFIGPCPNGLQVNHIDGDKLNNHINNLEYVTSKQNNIHARKTGLNKQKPPIRRGTQANSAKLTEEDVVYIKQLYNYISQPTIANYFNVDHKVIHNILFKGAYSRNEVIVFHKSGPVREIY